MRLLIETLALILNFAGIVLMIRYGLPHGLPVLGRGQADLSEAEHREDERRSMIGVVGLVLFALGTLLQIAGLFTVV
jgi:hypothetical protein